MFKSLALAALFSLTSLTAATQINHAGTIQVVDASNTATKLGCLTAAGKFTQPRAASECGTFSQFDNRKRDGAPSDYSGQYDLYTSAGSCTFRSKRDAFIDSPLRCVANYFPTYLDNFYANAVSLCSGLISFAWGGRRWDGFEEVGANVCVQKYNGVAIMGYYAAYQVFEVAKLPAIGESVDVFVSDGDESDRKQVQLNWVQQ
jgi:hypothetical protein